MVNIVNLVLCAVILLLGFLKFSKTKSKLPLYIAVAFALFGVSHLITILGGAGASLVIIRVVAYLIVIFALLK
jgi:hypothetical protein